MTAISRIVDIRGLGMPPADFITARGDGSPSIRSLSAEQFVERAGE
jgi:hypothetical protein